MNKPLIAAADMEVRVRSSETEISGARGEFAPGGERGGLAWSFTDVTGNGWDLKWTGDVDSFNLSLVDGEDGTTVETIALGRASSA